MSKLLDNLKNLINTHYQGYEPHQIVVEAVGGLTGALVVNYIIQNRAELKEKTIKVVFSGLKSLPGVGDMVEKEKDSLKDKLRKEFNIEGQEKFFAIPEEPLSHDEIIKRMTELKDREEGNWKNGKVSGVVYGGDDKHTDLLNRAYCLFSLTNPLHPDVFPSIRKFESEIIRMTAEMMSGDSTTCGVLTSGGTESILMAVKAYREFYNKKNPEMVVPVTAHAAFDKAAHYFGVKIVHVDVDKNMRADVNAMRKAINKNTIMLVGSAPQYAHGIIDPIEELAAIAKEHNIGFHTDACLGGYILPWVKKSGIPLPSFDFTVPGVTSISVDTHKYGYATKGTSVLLFRNEEIRHSMFFVQPNWPGGMYASPSIAGSRPGGIVACCWASLVATGQKGYREKSMAIWNAAQSIKEGIKKIKGIHLMGDSLSTVIAFGSKEHNVFKIADAMKSKGWNLNNLQRPNSVHICVTHRHINKAQEFLKDLEDSVEIIIKNPDAFPNGTAGVYGMAASFPDRGTVAELGVAYLDAVLEV